MAMLRVTEILSLAGLLPDRRFMDEASRQRGEAVHLAMRYLDEGDLDDNTIDPEIRGYMKAYQAWRKTVNGLRYEAIEEPVENEEEGITGRLDRVAMNPYGSGERAVIDFKTGKGYIPAWVGLQLVAYAWLYDPREPMLRIAVKLHPDGTFTERHFPTKEFDLDLQAFKGAICLAKWKTLHSRESNRNSR